MPFDLLGHEPAALSQKAIMVGRTHLEDFHRCAVARKALLRRIQIRNASEEAVAQDYCSTNIATILRREERIFPSAKTPCMSATTASEKLPLGTAPH